MAISEYQRCSFYAIFCVDCATHAIVCLFKYLLSRDAGRAVALLALAECGQVRERRVRAQKSASAEWGRRAPNAGEPVSAECGQALFEWGRGRQKRSLGNVRLACALWANWATSGLRVRFGQLGNVRPACALWPGAWPHSKRAWPVRGA